VRRGIEGAKIVFSFCAFRFDKKVARRLLYLGYAQTKFKSGFKGVVI